MTDEEITKLIEKTAEQTASKFMLRLNKTGRTAYIFLNSFKKTEELASRFFDGMTLSEISEIYDCQYRNISKQKNRLIKILAAELFPEDVLKELLER